MIRSPSVKSFQRCRLDTGDSIPTSGLQCCVGVIAGRVPAMSGDRESGCRVRSDTAYHGRVRVPRRAQAVVPTRELVQYPVLFEKQSFSCSSVVRTSTPEPRIEDEKARAVAVVFQAAPCR